MVILKNFMNFIQLSICGISLTDKLLRLLTTIPFNLNYVSFASTKVIG